MIPSMETAENTAKTLPIGTRVRGNRWSGDHFMQVGLVENCRPDWIAPALGTAMALYTIRFRVPNASKFSDDYAMADLVAAEFDVIEVPTATTPNPFEGE